MIKFIYWYAYFDSIFLKQNPHCSKSLISIIQSQQQEWSKGQPLPQLLACFIQLQQFILREQNWSESNCTIQQLNEIQKDVSNVLVLLMIEKCYVERFWKSKRRIQGSLVHLYALLQVFIRAVIPDNTMTLFQCKTANKLCLKIQVLQVLIKSLMKKINKICAFFSGNFFREEYGILKNFFENFVAFMKSIPKIKKIKMYHISQLLKYIIIQNTIQITSIKEIKVRKINNYKQKNKQQNKQQNKQLITTTFYKHLSTRSCQIYLKNIQIDNNGILIYKKKINKEYSCYDVKQSHFYSNQKQKKILIKFVFSNAIKKYSIKIRKQRIPKIIVEGLHKNNSKAQTATYTLNSAYVQSYRNRSITKQTLTKQTLSKSLKFDKCFTPLQNRRVKHSLKVAKILCTENILGAQQNYQSQSSFILSKLEQDNVRQDENEDQEELFCLETMERIKNNFNNNNRIGDLFKKYIIRKKLENILLQ